MNASWSKLAAALDEVGEDTAAGRIKEQYLGLPATSPVTPGAVLASLGSEFYFIACTGADISLYMHGARRSFSLPFPHANVAAHLKYTYTGVGLA